ncbi:hypothetical protein TNCT_576731 [Trichonephila clavata]|uniref:Uncharacterized protein n=1 Tax=Trichonephila clavata TaxID=2740835 RepID=A0A8X6LBR1_TRICU|nr:hypothetical protein TNCT_576731 [Trichonephila clavata]
MFSSEDIQLQEQINQQCLIHPCPDATIQLGTDSLSCPLARMIFTYIPIGELNRRDRGMIEDSCQACSSGKRSCLRAGHESFKKAR